MASDVSLLVRPLWTRCIATELKNEGADVDAALAASGLDWRSLNKADGWIPFVRHGGLPSIEQQKAYLLSHNIVSNAAFTEFTIGVGGTDFEYM